MAEQIFISYRRSGGDIYAKSICEALKNRGYTVFYDIDSISGGYFDDRILNAIAACDDFLLVLPPNSLDRCWNEGDWVRLEILEAMKHGKNIIPVLLPGFTFPADLPADIAAVARYNGVSFVMQYFDAVIDAIVKRLSARVGGTATARTEAPPPAPPKATPKPTPQKPTAPTAPSRYESEGLSMVECDGGYAVAGIGTCTDKEVIIPRMYRGEPVVAVADGAFSHGGTRLKGCVRFVIPEGVLRIGERAFAYACNFSLSLPRSLREIHPRAFYESYNISEITVDPNSPYYCTQDRCLFTKDMKTLVRYAHTGAASAGTYTVPDGVVRVATSAFFKVDLTEVKLPDGLQEIGEGAFHDCKKLASSSYGEMVLPKSVTSIGDFAFCGCESLRFVTLPQGLERIKSFTFRSCSHLSCVKLPSGLKVIESYAFYGCACLKKIDIPASVTEIDREAFKGCTSAQEIIFAGTKKEWKKVRLGDSAFKDVPPRVINCTDGEVRRWFI